MAPPPLGAGRRPALLVRTGLAAAVVAATAIAYAPALDGELQFDDWTSIETNWALRDPAALLSRIRPASLLGPGRPVTDLTFALDLARGGGAPRAFHETGLLLHLAAAALVLALAVGALRAAGHPRAGTLAALAAAAFALHPLQAESVCYAAQRSEVLASLLYVAALLALLRADAAWPRAAAWGWTSAAAALHLLGLGAKPLAVTLPAAFLLHRAVLGGGTPAAPPLRTRLLRALAVSAPSWALAAASVARNLDALGPADSAGISAGPLGPWRYLLTQWRVQWLYARLAIWPAGQNVDHALEPSPGLLDPPTLAAGLGLAAVVAAAAALWVRAEQGRAGAGARAVAFGIGWWLLLLAPTSSVVPILDLVAEHRVYLPLAGLLLALVAGADAAFARLLPGRGAWVATAGAVACAGLAVATHGRARLWGSPVALWADAVAGSPEKARALTNHAFSLQAAGRSQEALAAYRRAGKHARTPEEIAAVARNLSGLHLDAFGDPASALAVLDAAMGIAWWDVDVRRNRALALHALGRYDEAWVDARYALSRSPGDPVIQDLVGLLHVAARDFDAAAARFRRAREIDPAEPNYVEHHFLALFHAGRPSEACAAWAELLARGRSPGPAARARAAELACPR